jgi:hypothetical protein
VCNVGMWGSKGPKRVAGRGNNGQIMQPTLLVANNAHDPAIGSLPVVVL